MAPLRALDNLSASFQSRFAGRVVVPVMKTLKRFAPTAVVAVSAALGLAACGGSSNNATTPASSATGATGAASTSTKMIGGKDVLVTSTGMALYFNDQDKGGTRACTGECAKVWVPVQGATFQGHPLYTFASDGAGKITGDGVTDSFGGQSFTWHVASKGGSASSGSATPAPAPAPAPTSTGSSSSGGSSGGGYGY